MENSRSNGSVLRYRIGLLRLFEKWEHAQCAPVIRMTIRHRAAALNYPAASRAGCAPPI
jgi:hypothetical protein